MRHEGIGGRIIIFIETDHFRRRKSPAGSKRYGAASSWQCVLHPDARLEYVEEDPERWNFHFKIMCPECHEREVCEYRGKKFSKKKLKQPTEERKPKLGRQRVRTM